MQAKDDYTLQTNAEPIYYYTIDAPEGSVHNSRHVELCPHTKI